MRDATKASLMHLRCPLLTFCHKATEVTSGAGQLPASSSCSQFCISYPIAPPTTLQCRPSLLQPAQGSKSSKQPQLHHRVQKLQEQGPP